MDNVYNAHVVGCHARGEINEDASDSRKMELGGFRNSGKREFRTTSVVRSRRAWVRFSFLLARHIFSEEDDNAQGPAVRRLYPHYTRLFVPVAGIDDIDYVSDLSDDVGAASPRKEREIAENLAISSTATLPGQLGSCHILVPLDANRHDGNGRNSIYVFLRRMYLNDRSNLRHGREPNSAAGSHVHNGQTYYFCSHHCLAKFKEDPERFLKSPATGHPAHGHDNLTRIQRSRQRKIEGSMELTSVRWMPRCGSPNPARARSAVWRWSRQLPPLLR